ncbi:MAG: dephospho-CoA kinase [Desulfobacterales bacterium]|nr:MAG: dephospho-CoA kinase [Desulfobacterales bacterium]
MIVVGLTGGIATGKSTVSAILQEAGAVIIDADQIARKVVKKGQPAYHEIVKRFGQDILLPDGEINRRLLGAIIFNDPEKKKSLNRIVHPRVSRETQRNLDRIQADQPDAVVVLDVPLLIEAGMHEGLAEVIVVYAPENVQLQRLMARDNFAEADARARIQAQMPIETKKDLASIVIDNTGALEKTRQQTLEVYRYLQNKTVTRKKT